jgi:rRNA maturation RNase YbeY
VDRAKAKLRAGGAIGAVDVLVTVSGAPAAPRVEAWTRRLLCKARAKRVSLSVLLCGDARMRTLNRSFRRFNQPTDVLSFPFFEASSARAAARRGEFLGDLVIDLRREVQILLAHGLLHLLGYDHERDDGTMFRLQRRILLSAFGEGPDGVP